MHPALSDIPKRIVELATGALSQANMHAAFFEPQSPHWGQISVLNAAHAGELFIKAAIACEHPLLIFKDVFSLDDNRSTTIDVEKLLARGRTHDFEKLPQVLWAATGMRIANPACYEMLRKTRNSIQHFCAPEEVNFRQLSLEFIYEVIDPLIRDVFNLYAIEFHEDHNIGYDYLVGTLLRSEIKFSLPPDFRVGEIDPARELRHAEPAYIRWFEGEMERISGLATSS